MGAAGAVLLGLGLSLVLLGLLRLIQTEWERAATGSLSWLPYLIVLLLDVATDRADDQPHQPRQPRQGTEVMAKQPDPPQTAITRDDLEQRFRALQEGVRGQVDDKKGTFFTAAGIGGLLIVVVDLPARQARRQEEDDVRRDPSGVIRGDALPALPQPLDARRPAGDDRRPVRT